MSKDTSEVECGGKRRKENTEKQEKGKENRKTAGGRRGEEEGRRQVTLEWAVSQSVSAD